MRPRADKRANLNRAILLLQCLVLVLVGLCLVQVRRLGTRVEAALAAARPGPGRASAPPPSDPAALLDELRAACDDFLSYPQDPVEQRVAEKRMDAAVAALKALGSAGFEALSAALDTPTPAPFRQRVLLAMEGIDPARTAEVALRIFRSQGDPVLRMTAAGVAMRADPDRALPELLAFIRGSARGSFPLLGEAVTMAAQKGGPEVVQMLLELAEHPERDPSSHYRAIEALGRLKSPEAVDPLKRIILTEPRDGMRKRKAVLSLVQIQGKEACPFLEECERQERQEAFRLVLQDALRRECR